MKEIADYFDKGCDVHGDKGWAAAYLISEEEQYGKFAILTNSFDLQNSSILDIGCGQGDFYQFLNSKYRTCRYQGIDVSPKMIKYAKQKYKANFVNEDYLKIDTEGFDYIMASGIFNFKIDDQVNYLKKFIDKMYTEANKAITFNLASKYAPPELKFTHVYHYYDPVEILKHCFTLSKDVTLNHAYVDYEFLITMSKYSQ